MGSNLTYFASFHSLLWTSSQTNDYRRPFPLSSVTSTVPSTETPTPLAIATPILTATNTPIPSPTEIPVYGLGQLVQVNELG